MMAMTNINQTEVIKTLIYLLLVQRSKTILIKFFIYLLRTIIKTTALGTVAIATQEEAAAKTEAVGAAVAAILIFRNNIHIKNVLGKC
mmetsp:Transcript_5205/g.5784  ORF Transcript_5205/g.5784 Transcript_5205/m.5784 type:complete len:88 (-) Transcript_5205:336-599(-)